MSKSKSEEKQGTSLAPVPSTAFSSIPHPPTLPPPLPSTVIPHPPTIPPPITPHPPKSLQISTSSGSSSISESNSLPSASSKFDLIKPFDGQLNLDRSDLFNRCRLRGLSSDGKQNLTPAPFVKEATSTSLNKSDTKNKTDEERQ